MKKAIILSEEDYEGHGSRFDILDQALNEKAEKYTMVGRFQPE